MPAVINILLALRQRDAPGQGCALDIAMTDAMFTFAWFALAQGHATGAFPGARENLLAGASPRYQLYATKDGRFVACGALEQKFWDAFCDAIGLPAELRKDHRDPAAARAAVAALIRAETGEVWRARLAPADCCVTVIATLEEALTDPHFVERGLFARTVTTPGGARQPATWTPVAPAFRDGAAEALAPELPQG
jgi:crotonobetainyl-CoA:carnitine CoA-transferase CaiB-like acyl-CoA transferase